MNILVFDNDHLLNFAISASLKNENYTVFNSFNENETVHILKNNPIDLLISELMLSEKKELVIFPLIKKSIAPIIPIIIISKHLIFGQKVKCNELNLIAFFYKPFDITGIIDEVKQFNNTLK